MIKPKNHGIRWNDEDIKNIIIDIKNGLTLIELSDKYKRTSGAIKSRLLDISYELIYILNFDIDIVSNKINLSHKEISNHIDLKLERTTNILSIKNINYQLVDNELEHNESEPNKPEPIILNLEQQLAFNEFINKKNIFITGPGGTGKSVVIKEIIKHCKTNNINFGVTATTGSAAILIGGKTIHSFLGIGIGDKSPLQLYNFNIRVRKNLINKLKELKVLIIDEISLMDEDIFELISEYLLLVKNNTEPFGNLQIILSGDFCQLEPINGRYCFLSEIWNELNLKTIFLHKMIRQENDNKFQKILRSLRYGVCSDKTLNILKDCNKPIDNKDIIPTILYSKNINVDNINKKEYQKLILTNPHTIFEIKIDNKKHKDKINKLITSLDVPLSVEICINAQVIVTANINQDKGIVNGTRGIVTKLDPNNSVTIKTINNELIIINYFKTVDSDDQSLYFHYMPLKLAYALSIHKSQGTTLDAIEIDIGKDIFAAGQAYTALSRGRCLDNIIIKDVSKDSFIINDSVLEFYSKIDPKLKY